MLVFPYLKDVLRDIIQKTSDKMQTLGEAATYPISFYPGTLENSGEQIFIKSLSKGNILFPCFTLIFNSNSPKRKLETSQGFEIHTFELMLAIETKEYTDIDLRYNERFAKLYAIKNELISQLSTSILLHQKYTGDYEPDCIDIPDYKGFPGASRVDCILLQNLSINILPLKKINDYV